VRGFVDWVGAGRALTQTGRLRRADALALVELLDTGDVLDQRFPIQSSTELYHLTLLVEWANACGLVRVARERIVAVRKHAKRLEQTLRSWLLHQGRRDDVAAELMVHPQTVRYRMTQLRELYGDRLHDPAAVLELVIALGVQRPAA
jgi:DNA-binding PucR family transcriptional regulator